MNLSDIDYQILKYISNFEYVSKNDIFNNFQQDERLINASLQYISEKKYIDTKLIKKDNIFVAKICISDTGIKAICEYKVAKRKSNIKFIIGTGIAIIGLIISILSLKLYS